MEFHTVKGRAGRLTYKTVRCILYMTKARLAPRLVVVCCRQKNKC